MTVDLPRHLTEFYIGGAWRRPARDAGWIPVTDPSNGEVLAEVPEGTGGDVDIAVAAARAAAAGWEATSPSGRAAVLDRICDEIERRGDEFAALITAELGMPVALCRGAQVDVAVRESRAVAEVARSFAFEDERGGSLVVHEPIGVVGAITPWNYPLVQLMRKVAPALVAGCTIVAKPSEVTPLNAYLLADVIDSVGLPAGVFNLIIGVGSVVGEAIASHPGVDMVSITGSTVAGRRVSFLASDTIKRVALELGGKSPSVVLADADLSLAVPATLRSCFNNSGQTCSALTRMLVPRDRLADVESIVREMIDDYFVGDPHSRESRLGPLVSERQRESVAGRVADGVESGAHMVTTNLRGSGVNASGYYLDPVVFFDVQPEMAIASEEIFGPVLVVIGYETEEQAIEIANGSQYGLSAAVWSADEAHAHRVASQIKAGQVRVNGASSDPEAPFGGYKQSGNGRENGIYGLREYLEVKSILG